MYMEKDRKIYLTPRLVVTDLHGEDSLLSSSYVPVGGDTDHFDSEQKDWNEAEFDWNSAE